MKDFLYIGGSVLVLLAITYCVVKAVTHKAENKFKNHPGVTGILEHCGDTVYISPMAIIISDDKDVDLSKVRAELFDRVVRLRMIDIVESVNDPVKAGIDEEEINNLKRMATVQSAVQGISILKRLMLVDHMTKALYVGVQHRMELVSPDSNIIETNHSFMMRDAVFMNRISSIEHAVKREFLYALSKNEYDYFHVFATKVHRRIRKGSVHNKYSDEEVQSSITAHAYRLGLMIPRSYLRYDAVTFAIANWGKPEPKTDDNVIMLKKPYLYAPDRL